MSGADPVEAGRIPARPARGRPGVYALAFLLLLGAGAALAMELPPSMTLIRVSIGLSSLALLTALVSVAARR